MILLVHMCFIQLKVREDAYQAITEDSVAIGEKATKK
jgi:hypothetical protein